jgi:hypothetical protein
MQFLAMQYMQESAPSPIAVSQGAPQHCEHTC